MFHFPLSLRSNLSQRLPLPKEQKLWVPPPDECRSPASGYRVHIRIPFSLLPYPLLPYIPWSFRLAFPVRAFLPSLIPFFRWPLLPGFIEPWPQRPAPDSSTARVQRLNLKSNPKVLENGVIQGAMATASINDR